jgi:hypothetical protein
VGDRTKRAQSIADTLGLAGEEALAYIDSTDQARAGYVQRNLNRTIDDPAAYHLTLNVTRLNPPTSARIIGDSLIEWASSRALPVTA